MLLKGKQNLLYCTKKWNLDRFYVWLKIAGEVEKSGKYTNFSIQYKTTYYLIKLIN